MIYPILQVLISLARIVDIGEDGFARFVDASLHSEQRALDGPKLLGENGGVHRDHTWRIRVGKFADFIRNGLDGFLIVQPKIGNPLRLQQSLEFLGWNFPAAAKFNKASQLLSSKKPSTPLRFGDMPMVMPTKFSTPKAPRTDWIS